jgi:hypothetical protein
MNAKHAFEELAGTLRLGNLQSVTLLRNILEIEREITIVKKIKT